MKMTEQEKLSTYNKMVKEHYNGLFRYAYNLTNSEAIAEDVLQETLIRAWNALESLNEISKAKSWLITILRRENLRRVHKERVNETDSCDDFDLILKSETNLEDEMDKKIIKETILELKESYRTPLLLQTFMGMTVEEIALELNLNENTVSTRVFRGKALLVKRLKQKIKIKTTEKIKS